MDFDWDEGNRGKNLRHGVHDWEIEEAFLLSEELYDQLQDTTPELNDVLPLPPKQVKRRAAG